jgi:hypothetical protein
MPKNVYGTTLNFGRRRIPMPERNEEETQIVEFEIEELEQKIAPGLISGCATCNGCSHPGCIGCKVADGLE